MDSLEALKAAAAAAGVPVTHIGRAMGKRDNYVSNAATRGSTPKADTLARMLGVCGWALVAVPSDEIPAGALVIDAAE